MNSLVISTKNYKEALVTVSNELKIAPQLLDFTLLDTKTKLIDLENNNEIEINLEELNTEYVKQLIENNRNIKIEQTYELSFFKKEQPDYFDFSLSISKDMCSLYLIFKKELTKIPSFKELLIEEINKKKIKSGLLINLFETDFINLIQAKIIVHDIYHFNDEKFLIAESYKPFSVIHDKLKKLFTEKIEYKETEQIDYKKRGFIVETKENQELLEYIKPKDGTKGFSLKGLIIPIVLAEKKHEPTFKLGEGISFKETEDNIIFFATKSGFIKLTKDILEINNDLELKEISFKKTGNIEADLSSDINILVKEKNSAVDAISGVEVDAKHVNVEGSIGAGATIHAETITVDEQIHRNAEIRAKDIKVNRLKGKAVGDNIEIRLLEQGSIKGKVIKIGKSHGGTIIGEEVYIDELRSNTTIMASKLIHIKVCIGEDNHLIINPFALASKNDYDTKYKTILTIQNEINKIKKRVNEIYSLVSLEKDKYIEMKTKQIELKKKGISLPSHSIMFIKKYDSLLNEIKALKAHIEEKEFQKNRLQDDLNRSFLKVEDGIITLENKWNGFNKISFKTKPGKDLEYKTKANEFFKSIKAEYDILDEEYKIKKDI